LKRALSILMVVTLMAASLTGLAMAADNEAAPYYLSVTGAVLAVEESEFGFSVEIALPDTDREARAFLNITDRTVFPFEEEINVGDTVTAFYIANAPMIMIYPPQYTVAVLVNGAPASDTVTVDRFNPMEGEVRRYLSQAGDLIVNIGPDTEIVLADGQEFADGNIDGRRLVVIYSISTRSLPPMTTPSKIIVLFEDAVTGPLPLSPEDLPEMPVTTLPAPAPVTPWTPLPAPAPVTPWTTLPAPAPDSINASGWPIQVNGNPITAPAAFQTGYTVMVPLRAIAEALGYEVEWDAATRSIRLGVAINTWIGSTEVHIGRMAPQTISIAPGLVDGSTFVPLEFFRVIGINNAYAFEGQIVIDNINEPME